MNQQRGSTTSKIVSVIVGIVLGLALVIFGGLFVEHMMYTSKMDSELEQIYEWKMEDIEEDPINYLNFVEKKTKEYKDELKDLKIRLAQSLSRWTEKYDKAKAELNKDETLIKDLKHEYQDAENNDRWPITWREQQLSKSKAKRRIKTLFTEMKHEREWLFVIEENLDALKENKRRISKNLSKVKRQLSKIDSYRERLKEDGITNELKNKMSEMKGVLGDVPGAVAESKATFRSLERANMYQQDLGTDQQDVIDEDMKDIFESIDSGKKK